ncbi:TPA: hypothetical protein ACH3X3_003571 [Trebouxia sp. C0006]
MMPRLSKGRQDTESGNKRTKMPHEQATASNEASMSFLQDTAEDDVADMFEYMGQAVGADILDQRGRRVESYKAFKRLHWKLKVPQAANVCEWATHVHLELPPYNKTSGPVFGQGDDHHAFNEDEEYGEFDERAIYPTHTTPSISALSAIASLKANSTQSESSSLSSSAAHDASQELLKKLPNLSESEGTVERTGSPDEQTGLQPDHTPSNRGESSSTSPPMPKPDPCGLQVHCKSTSGKCSDMGTLQQYMQVTMRASL